MTIYTKAARGYVGAGPRYSVLAAQKNIFLCFSSVDSSVLLNFSFSGIRDEYDDPVDE